MRTTPRTRFVVSAWQGLLTIAIVGNAPSVSGVADAGEANVVPASGPVVIQTPVDAQELGFSVSMGVASFPHTAHSQPELLAASEGALSEARRRGGNHLTLASIRFEPV